MRREKKGELTAAAWRTQKKWEGGGGTNEEKEG